MVAVAGSTFRGRVVAVAGSTFRGRVVAVAGSTFRGRVVAVAGSTFRGRVVAGAERAGTARETVRTKEKIMLTRWCLPFHDIYTSVS